MKPTSIAYAAIGLICFVAGFLVCGVVCSETGGTAMTKINAAQILPIAMILLDVGAAAVLNATVTF